MKEGKKEEASRQYGKTTTVRKIIVALLATLILASVHLAEAQQGKVYYVGVLAPIKEDKNIP